MSLQSIAIDSLLALSVWASLGTGRFALSGTAFMACGAYAASLAEPHVRGSVWLSIGASAALSYLLGALVGRWVNRLSAESFSLATLSFSLAAPAMAMAPHLARAPGQTSGNAFAAMACLVAGVVAVGAAKDSQRFAVGAAAAGVAGALYWSTGGALDPAAFGLGQLGVMVAIALVGGAASPVAPVLGALILALLAKIAAPLTDQPLIVYGCALTVALVYMPDGAWPPLAAATRAISRTFGSATRGPT